MTFDPAEMRQSPSAIAPSRPFRLHDLTERQFTDCDTEQPLCFMGCGNPVDVPGDCCSQACEQLARRLADQAAEAAYG